MEAKDTIIKLKAVPTQIFEGEQDTIVAKMCYLAGWKDGTEAQVEISFKMGYNQALKDVLESKPAEPWDREETIFEDGKNAGIKEVVEWFMHHGGECPIRYSDGRKARFDPPWDELQAILKEWNIEEAREGSESLSKGGVSVPQYKNKEE